MKFWGWTCFDEQGNFKVFLNNNKDIIKTHLGITQKQKLKFRKEYIPLVLQCKPKEQLPRFPRKWYSSPIL